MGWAVGYDSNWNRDIGYGVPAYCDHPKCNEVIDRGLSFVCCDQGPYGGDNGCGLFFCAEHKRHYRNGESGPMCKRCATYRPPYKRPKPDHPDWISHKETDPSWAPWRKERDATRRTA